MPDNLDDFISSIKSFGINATTDQSQLESIVDNITGISVAPSALIQPTSADQVAQIISLANEYSIPIYPFSRGCNWGYGSKNAVIPNCVLLDLSGLNRILNPMEVSKDHPVVVIEPGVTQQQLYEFLEDKHPYLTFNVTGAGKETSIIGNSLDRGVGYFGPRHEDLFGLEVVTGSGETIKTGFRRLGDDSPLAQVHPYGMGPILDGLFSQGNSGIVISACFRLIPRRPVNIAFSLGLKDSGSLPEFINILSQLKREGIISSVTHIGNRERTQSSLQHAVKAYLMDHCNVPPDQLETVIQNSLSAAAPNEWSSLASLSGNFIEVLAKLTEIKIRTRKVANIRVVTDGLITTGYTICNLLRAVPFFRKQAAAAFAVKPLHGLALGRPTDAPLDNLINKFSDEVLLPEELDHSSCGLLFFNPALPQDGSKVTEIIHSIQEICRKFELIPYITLNVETETSLVGVINVLFNRKRTEEVAAAHQCAREISLYFKKELLSPYRLRADMMEEWVDEESPYWQTAYILKKTIDPNDIIAPGRYSITERI